MSTSFLLCNCVYINYKQHQLIELHSPKLSSSPIKKVIIQNSNVTFFLLQNGKVLVSGHDNSIIDLREYEQTKDLIICDMFSNDQSCIFLGYDNQMYICGSVHYTIETTGIKKGNLPLRMLTLLSDKTKYYVTHIALAATCILVVTDCDEVHVLGQPQWFYRKPQTLETSSKIAQITAGYYHAAILTSDGEAWVCGENNQHYKRGDVSMVAKKFFNLNQANGMNEKYVYVLASGEISVFATATRKIYIAGFDLNITSLTTSVPNTGLRLLNYDFHSNIRNIFVSLLRFIISTDDKLLICGSNYNSLPSTNGFQEISYNNYGLSCEFNMYTGNEANEIYYLGKQSASYWIQRHFYQMRTNLFDIEFIFY
jgi:hypothetical protein